MLIKASSSELDMLQSFLNQALDAIREEIVLGGYPPLSNTATVPHPLDDHDILTTTRLYEARKLAIATMGQIKNLIQTPFDKVLEQSFAIYDNPLISTFLRTGMVDYLAAQPNLSEGVHVQELHRALDLDPAKITVLLRYLSAQGWVYEKTEGIFALCRPCLELRKGCNSRDFILPPGKPKLVDSLFDAVTRPEWKYSTKHTQCAFQLAFQTELPMFNYIQSDPELLHLWSNAMKVAGRAARRTILNDYPWEKFCGCTFIDVAGGQGDLSMDLAMAITGCNFVVQDRPEVVELARANVTDRCPEILRAGRITFEACDIFDSQPRAGEDINYVFRHIMHDWPDEDCIKILSNVALVADRRSKVLIIDAVVPTATPSHQKDAVTLDDLVGVTEYKPITPPTLVPSNFGAHAKILSAFCVDMMCMFNAYERTFREWQTMLLAAGLRIIGVYPLRANDSIIECEFISV